MSETCAEMKTRLDALNSIYYRVTQGGVPRVIQDSDGSRIEYTVASAPRLRLDIALLQAQYDACLAGRSPILTRPIQFYF